jgi:hypothetical protein
MTILSIVRNAADRSPARNQTVRAHFAFAATLFALALTVAFGTPNARALSNSATNSNDGAAAAATNGAAPAAAAATSAPAAAAAAGDVPTGMPKATPFREPIVPADKQISAHVRNGIFTFDGLTAKVQLNYDVKDANYLYFYIPGLGTAIVSRVQVPGAIKVKGAVHGDTLSFAVGGHIFELANQNGSLDEHFGTIYVVLDTAANNLDRQAMVGFGNTLRAPYVWPLSAVAPKDTAAHMVAPPPVPQVLLPKTVAVAKPRARAVAEVAELNQDR